MKDRLCQIMNGTTACASRKMFSKQWAVSYTHNMQVLHSDNRKRVTLPDPARPKDSWIPEVIGPNQIVLTRVEKPARGGLSIHC